MSQNDGDELNAFLSETRMRMDQVIKPIFENFKKECEKRGSRVESYILSNSGRPYPSAGFRVLDSNAEKAREIHIGLSLQGNCIEVEKETTQSGQSERSLWDVLPHPSALTPSYIERQMSRMIEDYFQD